MAMQDDEAPPSRLDAVMDMIDELLDARPGEHAVTDIMKWRRDVERTAFFLLETYGEEAVARAALLEQRRKDSGFAKAVRLAVESLARGGGKP